MLATVGALMKQPGIGEPTEHDAGPKFARVQYPGIRATPRRITAMANQLNTPLLKTADDDRAPAALDSTHHRQPEAHLADHTRIDVGHALNRTFVPADGRLGCSTSACAIAIESVASRHRQRDSRGVMEHAMGPQ